MADAFTEQRALPPAAGVQGGRAHAGPTPADDFAEHQRTYRLFVKGVMLFAAHALAILVLLALFLL